MIRAVLTAMQRFLLLVAEAVQGTLLVAVAQQLAVACRVSVVLAVAVRHEAKAAATCPLEDWTISCASIVHVLQQ